eukprot:CAMPEP_0171125166 /NCGR_PEP_ID=MMETSP0766_2-20121228/110690_1 /TAXON_ID=439317 /ORGANISM="Gambierdiscus australes, Strain CAWD 149" /LENGTH=30 /DNA_ID= /DNA_START= /DNA_END= /DNA_ORIENTATION=
MKATVMAKTRARATLPKGCKGWQKKMDIRG